MDAAQAFYQQTVLLQQPMWAAEARGDSEIRQFYSGATVFLTGGTGFLGKLLIEKLIRSCDVYRIYVLIRAKKNNTMQERLKMLIKDSVFEELRSKHANFAEKIYPIEGDVAEIRLGINDQDWNKLVEQVNITFHVAATTKFDETLQRATLINIRGTREMLRLAKSCKHLRSYVHISTAYSHSIVDRIGSEILEKLYVSPIPPDAMIQIAERMESKRLIDITKKLISGWPNTYTFTKAVTEDLIRTEQGDLPICIIRPPIVTCTYKEPSPGWIDEGALYGASGVVFSALLGILRVMLGTNPKMCIMPADYVNNLTLAAGRETAKRHSDGDKTLKLYNHSNTRTGFTWGMMYKYLECEQSRSMVGPSSVWYCCLVRTSNRFIFWLLNWLLHYIPAYILDAVFHVLKLQKPNGIQSFVKIYTKLNKLCLMLTYFLSNEFNFNDDNTVDLYNSLSATDKALFNFDVMSIDWKQLMTIWVVGTRKYIIKDGLKDTARGVKKQFWFKIASYVILFVYAYVFYKIFYLSLLGIKYIFIHYIVVVIIFISKNNETNRSLD